MLEYFKFKRSVIKHLKNSLGTDFKIEYFDKSDSALAAHAKLRYYEAVFTIKKHFYKIIYFVDSNKWELSNFEEIEYGLYKGQKAFKPYQRSNYLEKLDCSSLLLA